MSPLGFVMALTALVWMLGVFILPTPSEKLLAGCGWFCCIVL